MPPRIAIPIPTSIDLPYNQRSWPSYASAVSRSGGTPIAIDITLPPAEILALAATCHGVVLPGSPADVDPALYGTDRLPECGPADPFRETADRILLEEAEKTGKPVLAICYGLQFLNVWRGGSLIQDLSPLPVNHSAGATVAIAHTAVIAPQSLLATLADTSEAPLSGDFLRLPVNTSHHQSVAAPGQGLRIVARCPDDGVIEALELDPNTTHPLSELFHVEQSAPSAPPETSSSPETSKLFHVEQSELNSPPEVFPAPETFKLFHVEQSNPTSAIKGSTESQMFHVEQSLVAPPSTPPTEPRLFHVEQSVAPDTATDADAQIVPRGTIQPQFLLGIQWHPERSYDISPTSRALFDRLILEAKLQAEAR
jgi:putative glutamine amidotransferase